MRACTAAFLTACGLAGAAAPAVAEQPFGFSDTALPGQSQTPAFELDETYVMGVVERRLDARSELIGWHLNGSWYLGREHGDFDEAVALIWQGDHHEQFSISTEGIRFTRRF